MLSPTGDVTAMDRRASIAPSLPNEMYPDEISPRLSAPKKAASAFSTKGLCNSLRSRWHQCCFDQKRLGSSNLDDLIDCSKCTTQRHPPTTHPMTRCPNSTSSAVMVLLNGWMYRLQESSSASHCPSAVHSPQSTPAHSSTHSHLALPNIGTSGFLPLHGGELQVL